MPSRRRMIPSVFAALMALALLPGAARAQSYAGLVWDQLQSQHSELSKESYGARRYIVSTLNNNRSDTWTMGFTAGYTYQIRGACDQDCRDVDIEVTDLNGKVLFQDLATDDSPKVSFDVTGTGDLKVKVTMRQCSEEPCFWGIGVWSKSR